MVYHDSVLEPLQRRCDAEAALDNQPNDEWRTDHLLIRRRRVLLGNNSNQIFLARSGFDYCIALDRKLLCLNFLRALHVSRRAQVRIPAEFLPSESPRFYQPFAHQSATVRPEG